MAGTNGGAGWNTDAMEKELRSMIRDGCLSDLVEVEEKDLKNPRPMAFWRHLPFKLYVSPTATRVLTAVLDHTVPGTPVTYNAIISAITQEIGGDSFCYIIGGQVRDILKGKISKDVDFNYACSAQEVARLCVEKEWPVMYKAIGPVAKPNYVMIGDEQSGLYMEGFNIGFSGTAPCIKQDFRQNMVFYDLTNHVIIDKSGYGVADIRNHELRFSCAPSKDWDEWASLEATLGEKALRYVKFVVRSHVQGRPLKIDSEECAFVVTLLKRALRDNEASLRGYWFAYLLGEFLRTQEGVRTLYRWVCDQGGPSLWEELLPFVQPKVADPNWLASLAPRATVKGGAELAKRAFEASDKTGDGLITEEDLKNVMRALGVMDVEMLVASLHPTSPGKFKYNDFLDFVFGT